MNAVRDEASNVDLPDALRPGPGEQGMSLDERQSVVDRDLMRLFDHSRHCRISDRPQGRHRLHRGERHIITGNRLGPRPGVFRDPFRQLRGIDGFPAVLGLENLRATSVRTRLSLPRTARRSVGRPPY